MTGPPQKSQADEILHLFILILGYCRVNLLHPVKGGSFFFLVLCKMSIVTV